MSSVVAGLDIGTCFVRAVIGIIHDDNSVELVDVAKKPSSGLLRNGTIVNIEAATKAITDVIDEAEQNSGLEAESVVVGIGGVQIESINSKGVVAISSYGKKERAVTQEDVARVIECANSIHFPSDRKLIHLIPQTYYVDKSDVGKNPVGNIACKLEVDVNIITASSTQISNITRCIEQTSYTLDEVVLKTLACTDAVMLEDERKLGSVLIDIGGGTTDAVVIVNDAPICTCSVRVGGNAVTNDISIIKGVPTSIAEKIKLEGGCCWLPMVEQHDEEVIIPGFGSRGSELTSKLELARIIEPRMKEILEMVRNEIKQKLSGVQFSGSIILTGGGAEIPGCLELTEAVFGTSSVRLGIPQGLGGMEDKYRFPEWATSVGLVLARKEMPRKTDDDRKRGKAKHKPSEKADDGKESMLSRFMRKFF